MSSASRPASLVFALAAALISLALAQPAGGQTTDSDAVGLEASQSAANSRPGPRSVPSHVIPVPDTVSPQIRALIAAPYRAWVLGLNPKNAAEWKEFVAGLAGPSSASQPALRKKLGVSMRTAVIGGVKCFILTPKDIPVANRNRLLVHVHGGGYVLGPGESGTQEATLMAAFGGFKVISVDYRMPPDFPYPAPLDDAMAVWGEAVKMQNPRNMAIFGTSTGGGMTLAMILRAKRDNLPLPGAIAPGTPWSDLTETGDSYKTNEWVDNALVSYRGFLASAARVYANGHDLKDPMLSPVYGDFHGFPPAILTTGTRDLFLSNTVRVHRKLRQAGVEAQLQVFEGMSHGQYVSDPDAPETKEAFREIARFFDAHLGR